MTYQQTLDWMFAQLQMYQEKGKIAYNGKLENIRAFSTYLDCPHKKFKSIHVAGTNGKGSSSHMLASILQEAGYKVGLYTSPHLKDFRERIRINGRSVSEKFVVDFVEENKSFFDTHKLSFFEMTVGMAFDYFAAEAVDIAIIEVGLGGRFDATNIIRPELALITNIGMDHVDILGDSLEKIAFEKGGVIKENVPIIISEYQEETAAVFISIANEKSAKIVFADKLEHPNYASALLGNYQSKNIKGVLSILNELQAFKVDPVHIALGLKNVISNTALMGRWHILGESPKIVCDTAHNSEGLSMVMAQIQEQSFDALHIVIGFVKDKNRKAVLTLFPKNAQYYFCRPDIQRGLNAESLRDEAARFDLKGETYSSVSEAYGAAKKMASPTDFIFIGGSNFVVAEVV